MNYLKYIISLIIFGSVGIFVKNINLSSTHIVFFRTAIASLVFMTIFMFTSKKIDIKAIKENFIFLIFSGFCVGFDSVCLFEAYKYTKVSIATLLYYTAPIFVIILAPIFLKEKITFLKFFSITIAIIGMFFMSGLNIYSIKTNYGLFLSLLGAIFYAFQVIFNKKIKKIDTLNSTFIQILVAAIVMFIYIFIINKNTIIIPDTKSIILVTILGVIHTGFAYYLYFENISKLPTSSVVILSYIDPLSSVFFAYLFLNENLTKNQIIGAILILLSTLVLEIFNKKS